VIKGCIHMGAAPDLDWVIDAPPVDHVSRAIVTLSRSASSSTPAFHLLNARSRHWRECVVWMNLFGYRVRLLSYEAWTETLARTAVSPEHPLYPLRPFFLRQDAGGMTTAELYQQTATSRPVAARTHGLEADAGLVCPRLDADMLERWFNRYIERGVLPAPPAARSSPRAHFAKTCHEDAGFVERLLRRHFDDSSIRVREYRRVSSGSDHSIIGELTSWRGRRRTGLFEYIVTLERQGRRETLPLVIKAKAADRDVIEVAATVGGICDPALGRAIAEYADRLPIRGGHLRELAIYDEAGALIRRHMPRCYATWRDDEHQEWGLALARLDDAVLIDSDGDLDAWSPSRIEVAVTGLADLHAEWYDRDAVLRQRTWIGNVPSRASALEMLPLWCALRRHAEPYLMRWASRAIVDVHRELVESIGDWWPVIDNSPHTLVHNDFNPRNLALEQAPEGLRLCAYDWELAAIGIPQSDLAEFLCFVLSPDVAPCDVLHWMECHRAALARATGRSIDTSEWRSGFRAALADLIVNRLAFYTMINRVKPQPFLPRIVKTWWRLHTIFN
jgi:hypothetical protein